MVSTPVPLSIRDGMWSVAGFVGAVIDGVFGLAYDDDTETWVSNPTLPNAWFTEDATLYIHGQEFTLGSSTLSAGQITWLDTSDWKNIYAPKVPTLHINQFEDSITLEPDQLEGGASFTIYKEDQPLQSQTNIPSDTPDPLTTTCYTITTNFEGSTQTSHPAAPVCVWGDNADHVNSVYADDLTIQGGSYATHQTTSRQLGRTVHTIQGEIFISESGRHLLQALMEMDLED